MTRGVHIPPEIATFLIAVGPVDISTFMPERSGPVHLVEAAPEQLAAYRDERRARKAAAWARRNRKAAP